MGTDAVAGAGGGGLLGVVHQMGVAGGRADLGMAENPTDGTVNLMAAGERLSPIAFVK